MLGWIALGLAGMYAYGQYSNNKDRESSFYVNNTKNYTKFGTMTFLREETNMIKLYVDDFLFIKINPAGKGKIDIVRVYNLPVGGKLSYYSVPLLGDPELKYSCSLEAGKMNETYNEMKEVGNDYMGHDMSI